uniref:Mechanosensitive ion channel protein MscS n=2 Tax=Mizugakiibacter sediminis TaxID=1475481 RepID=A0A0S6YX57_9GAMM
MQALSDWLAHPWMRLALAVAVALALGTLAARAVRFTLRRLLEAGGFASIVLRRCAQPFELALPLIAAKAALHSGMAGGGAVDALQHAATVAVVAALTWLGVRAISGVERAVIARHPVDVEDNLQARRVRTQTRVLARTAMFAAGLFGLAAALMTFPGVRQLGASLLASAGVAGLVVGLAARPVLSNLLAGLQIALTQPIRIDDVVIVEGEWGRIEEITGAYVVVNVWDERRLVVPLQWFIEHPFQNWTRTSARLIGSVFLWVDYALPLAPLRAELERVCHAAPEWDGRVSLLQVTDADARAMQVRALVSATDSGRAWDLRCRVREALIDFLQREYPQHLPRLRIDGAERARAGAA